MRRMYAMAALTALCLSTTSLIPAAADAPPQIELLNPSDFDGNPGTLPVVSDKGLGTDGAYRLVAWVRNAPPDALVEFEVRRTGQKPITLGTAVPASEDTFDLGWNISPTLGDGQYTIRALLYGNTGTLIEQVDSDDQAITLLHGSPTADRAGPAAEALDITYPTGEGAWGLNKPSDDAARGVIDVAPSEGTTFVRVFYTTTAPGGEPAWQECGDQGVSAAEDGVKCELSASDAVAAVTAVAAVANHTPDALANDADARADDAGDARRVVPYVQEPTMISLTPSAQRIDPGPTGRFSCSSEVNARVTDQLERPITDVNVDIHATGPSDQLSFDTNLLLSGTQPPDRGHVVSEPGFDCLLGSDAENVAGDQAEHNIPGAPDRKHVESDGDGTDDGGIFAVTLLADQAGRTELVAWVDVQDNDQVDPQDPICAAAVGWGQDVSTPFVSDPGAARVCPGAQPPPAAVASPEPLAQRVVGLTASRDAVSRGDRIKLFGTVTGDTRCVAGQSIGLLRRDPRNGRRFRPFGMTTATSADGTYSFRITVNRSFDYMAVAHKTDGCARAESNVERVRLGGRRPPT